MINNKDFTYNIYVDKFRYLKIEEKFIFHKVENFMDFYLNIFI